MLSEQLVKSIRPIEAVLLLFLTKGAFFNGKSQGLRLMCGGKPMKIAILLLLQIMLITETVQAADSAVLRFETSPFRNSELVCDFDDNVTPEKNDFNLIEYALMSSDFGDRFAILTIQNTSSGQRILNEKHVVAVFGNCERRYPLSFTKKFAGSEKVTITIPFGFWRFPILKVQMEKDKL